MESGATDGQSGEGDVRDKLGSVLQNRHNLTIMAFNKKLWLVSLKVQLFEKKYKVTKNTKGANRCRGVWL